MLVGVYGTLKKGFRANDLLEDSELVKDGFFKVKYRMHHIGGFPALIPSKYKNKIYFEIYDVKDESIIEHLDNYEGYPSLFKKNVFEVDGKSVMIYTAGEGICGRKQHYEIIKSGKYEGQKNDKLCQNQE